ncbi:unnamed protein product, partial [Polarella glacialis]
MMIMSFPLGYYNRAQVIPMFFGFLLLVFNGVQEDIEADQTDEKPAVDTVYVVYTVGFIFFVFELPALVLETNKMMIMRFPLWYHNCAQVIPMFFGFLLLVFNGVQVGIEADQTDDKPAVDTVYVAYTVGFIFFVLFLVFRLKAVTTLCIWASAAYELPALVLETNKIMIMSFPLRYYNCAQVIPMFFGFLLLVFNGVQEDIEANSASDIQRKPTAADWMSGSSFVGMAGTLYALGYDGLAYIIGWTRGYVLVSTMISPYLRRFGSFTRGKNRGAQLRVPVPGDHRALSCSFTYLTAQVYSTGVIVSRFIGIQFEVAVFSCIISVIFCSLLGGMRAVTYTQVAQYVILIIAYTVPAICMSTAQDVGFNKNKPVELLAYGGTLQQNALKEKERFIGSRDEGTMQLPGEKVVELSGVSRFLATSVLLSCSFTYLTAQVDSIGVIVSRFIGIQSRWPSSAASSDMRAVTYTQRAQYVILIIAYTVPAMCMTTTQDDGFIMKPSGIPCLWRQQPTNYSQGEGASAAGTGFQGNSQPKWRRVDFF